MSALNSELVNIFCAIILSTYIYYTWACIILSQPNNVPPTVMYIYENGKFDFDGKMMSIGSSRKIFTLNKTQYKNQVEQLINLILNMKPIT